MDQLEFNVNDVNGVPNAVQLSDTVIGGGEPSTEALEELKLKGFKTVIDTRVVLEGVPLNQRRCEEIGFQFFNIPVSGWVAEKQVNELAEIVNDPQNHPILIHCATGPRVFALWDEFQKTYG